MSKEHGLHRTQKGNTKGTTPWPHYGEEHSLKSQKMKFWDLGSLCMAFEAHAMVGFVPALDCTTYGSYPYDY